MSNMKKISRRKQTDRDVWSEDKRNAETDLIIPPCELWHGDSNNTSQPVSADTPKSTSIPNENRSQCWAFMGAIGGVGTTTLAVQLAYELIKRQSRISGKPNRKPESQVCIVDLDFESGSCIHHLDVEPALSHDDLSGDPLRIDSSITDSFINTHGNGISVLAAPNVVGANERINTQTVLALLDTVTSMFPYVILDLPKQWQAWSYAALGGSDFVGLLCDLAIPSLHMARSKKEQLAELMKSETPCEVILNKYERRSFKNTLQLVDAEMALQCELFSMLCEDSSVTQEAINCGEPVGSIRANSRYAKDSRKLLEQILSFTKTKDEHVNASVKIAS